jgi:hypothetical protein
VLRRIFGPKKDEVTESWENCIMRCSIICTPHQLLLGIVSYACKMLVGLHEGKRPLGRPSRRWEENFEMDFKKLGWKGVNWIQLAQDRARWRAAVNMAIKLRVPYKAKNFMAN